MPWPRRQPLTPEARLARARKWTLALIRWVSRPLTAYEINQYARGPDMTAAERVELLTALKDEGLIVAVMMPGDRRGGGTWVDGAFKPDPVVAYKLAVPKSELVPPLNPRD